MSASSTPSSCTASLREGQGGLPYLGLYRAIDGAAVMKGTLQGSGATGGGHFVSGTVVEGYLTDSGSANAYAITPSPAISAYAAKQAFRMKAANTNTTTSTLNVSGLGVKTIKKYDGATNLSSGDIQAGQVYDLAYDGTNFLILNPGASGTTTNPMDTLGQIIYGGASGTQTKLNGNSAVSNQWLRSKGTGSAAAPTWQYNGAIWNSSADVTLASFTSAATLLGTGVGIKTLPAAALAVGDSIEIEAWGYYSDTATPNYTFTINIGGSTAFTLTVTGAAGSANSPWRVNAKLVCQTAGASGKVKGMSVLSVPNETTASVSSNPTTQTTVDTTGTLAVDVQVACSSSSSSNTITCSGGYIKFNKMT